jgi:hypothetical protein
MENDPGQSCKEESMGNTLVRGRVFEPYGTLAPGHSAEVRGLKVTLKAVRRRKSSVDGPWKSGHFVEEG